MDSRELALELRIELAQPAAGGPPRGWLGTGAEPAQRFESYVQLIALLEQLRAGADRHRP